LTVRVSAVIPNKNGAGLVGRCVEAATASGAAEVIVIDDGSTDESAAEAADAGAHVIASPGRGFAAAVNAGAAVATGEALLLLNSDCFLEPAAVGSLGEALAADGGLAVCAAGLVEPNGVPNKSCGPLLTLGLAVRAALSANPRFRGGRETGVEDVPFVPLACAAVRRTDWDACGGLDERFTFYFEDQDICRRLHDAGRRIAVDWDAVAIHVGGGSSSTRDEHGWFLQYVRSRARYLRKHYARTWPVFAVVWAPAALARAAAWCVRPGADSRRWARTWLIASWAGISG